MGAHNPNIFFFLLLLLLLEVGFFCKGSFVCVSTKKRKSEENYYFLDTSEFLFIKEYYTRSSRTPFKICSLR